VTSTVNGAAKQKHKHQVPAAVGDVRTILLTVETRTYV